MGEPNSPLPDSPTSLDRIIMKPGKATHTVLTTALAECLLDYLPVNLRVPGTVEWVLRYSPKAHGVSMATLYRNLADRGKSIIMVLDAEEHIFGGFASVPWEPSSRF